MELTIVIVLIVALVVIGIFINAMQQHKERVDAEKRTEIAKQRAVVDETEDLIMAITQMPITPQMVKILHTRVHNALKVMYELDPKQVDIKQRVKDAEERVSSINLNEPTPSGESFKLPDNDKQIIVYIQAIKKLRQMLRSENSKGKIDSHTFMQEDKRLTSLQLRVNVETLAKRGAVALKTNMLGSARQYFEKALAAIEAAGEVDDTINARKAFLQEQLHEIQQDLANVNAEDRKKRQEEERDELDELFAPKKKW